MTFAGPVRVGDTAAVADIYDEDERPTLTEQLAAAKVVRGQHPSGLDSIELAVLMPFALGSVVTSLWSTRPTYEQVQAAEVFLEAQINSAQVWQPSGLFEKLSRRVETAEPVNSVLCDVLRLIRHTHYHVALVRIQQEIADLKRAAKP